MLKVALELIKAFVKNSTSSSQSHNLVKWEYTYVMHMLLESVWLSIITDSNLDMRTILPYNHQI